MPVGRAALGRRIGLRGRAGTRVLWRAATTAGALAPPDERAIDGAWATRARSAPGRSRMVLAIAAVAGLTMVLATGWIVADASVGASPVLPLSPDLAGWLGGLTSERLGYGVFLECLLAFTVSYAVLLPLARRLPTRAIVGLVAVLYLLVFIGPILLSTDVFSYVGYARMGAVHGLNPYVHVPAQISADPIYPYVGGDWTEYTTAYGPLYTLLSYPLALLGVAGAIWAMKVVAVIACVCMARLTWRCAQLRGLEPRLALLVVAANPLVVIYSLASAHNDFLMIALMMAAVYLTLRTPTTPAQAGGATVAGAVVAPGLSDAGGLATGGTVADAGALATGGTTETVAASGNGATAARRAGAAGASALLARLDAREAWAGAAIVAATLVKASTAAMLPYMILGRRRGSAVAGALAALVLGLLTAYLAFGVHGMNIVSVLGRDSAYVSTDSFATEIAHLLGKPGVYPVDHDFLKGLLAVVGVYLLWRTWRGYDWIAASGWALLAITVTTTWLLAWYLIWPLPIAAASRDRRLLWATLAVQALFIVHQLSPLFTVRT